MNRGNEEQSMSVLAINGWLRAGKSTLIANTLRHGVRDGVLSPMRTAWLLNDRPTEDGHMVDGDNVRDIAQVIPFANRCFTCQDTEELSQQLQQLAEGGQVDLTIIEGYGFVSGAETRLALEKSGYHFEIFTVLDAQRYPKTAEAFGDALDSQIASATLGIGLTHLPATSLPEMPAGVPVMEIHEGEGIPLVLLQKFLQMQKKAVLECTHHGCDHDHHDHHHGEHHHHEHKEHDSFFHTTFPLRAEVTLDQLQSILAEEPVVSAKGYAGGQRFDMLQGDWWTTGEVTDTQSIITIYSQNRPVELPLAFLREEKAAVQGTTKDLLRKDVHPEAAQEALAELAERIPTSPVILSGEKGLRVAVQLEELQLLKQTAQRPNMKDAWLVKAVDIALRYWVACAQFIDEHRHELDPSELPVSLQELGLSLGWWAKKMEALLPPELIAQVAACNAAQLLHEGTKTLGMAEAQRAYYHDVASFAEKHGGEGVKDLHTLLA